MRRALYVPFPPAVREALYQLSDAELRDPRLQARLLVEDGLRRRGLLVEDPQPATVGGHGGEDDPPLGAA